MTYTGRVHNGVVVFEGPERPPEGSLVSVDEVTPPANAAVGEALDRIAGEAKGLPSDWAEHHDQYRRERRAS